MVDQVQTVTLKIQKGQGLTQALLAHVRSQNMEISDGKITGAEWNAAVDKLVEIQNKRKEENKESIFTGGTERKDWHKNFVVRPNQEIEFTKEEMDSLYEAMGVSFKQEEQSSQTEEAEQNPQAEQTQETEQTGQGQQTEQAQNSEQTQQSEQAQETEQTEQGQQTDQANNVEQTKQPEKTAKPFKAKVGAPSRYHKGFTIKEIEEDGDIIEVNDKNPNLIYHCDKNGSVLKIRRINPETKEEFQVHYNKDHKVYEKSVYKNGKHVSTISYDDNGKKSKVYDYKNKRIIGYINGKVSFSTIYYNENLTKMKKITIYNNGKANDTRTYDEKGMQTGYRNHLTGESCTISYKLGGGTIIQVLNWNDGAVSYCRPKDGKSAKDGFDVPCDKNGKPLKNK